MKPVVNDVAAPHLVVGDVHLALLEPGPDDNQYLEPKNGVYMMI